tara:strand:- start:475 stop:738 length:264 start_codon:yes stop_codon:yes gene_type:complete
MKQYSVAGFLYAGFVGGIPGPDDLRAEAAHVSLHNMIGFGAVWVGVLLLLGGIVARAIRLFHAKSIDKPHLNIKPWPKELPSKHDLV